MNRSNPDVGIPSWINANRERMVLTADIIVVALAVSLPWSTTATGILVVLWIIAFLPSLEKNALQRTLLTPAGGIPVLLWALGVIGMLWADVSLMERLKGLGSFHKLLIIPLLMVHFQRSEHGQWVMRGFLLSCGVLLVISWAMFLFPKLPWPDPKSIGVPVKDYISQSAMFIVCIAALVDLALRALRRSRFDIAAAYVLLAIMFLANILFISTSRTALVILPIIFLIFGLKRFGWKGTVWLMIALCALAVAAWSSSEYLRIRVTTFIGEVQDYRNEKTRTSAGERLEFWRKSLQIVADAPVIGHGTGTVTEQFRRVVTGESRLSALVATNPHNQTFAVAIQLGLVGTIVLFAMWVSHLLLFRGDGLAAWIGLTVVVQNVIGSLFNSHLFDFTHGWGYAIGVGIAGGIMLQNAMKPGRAQDQNGIVRSGSGSARMT